MLYEEKPNSVSQINHILTLAIKKEYDFNKGLFTAMLLGIVLFIGCISLQIYYPENFKTIYFDMLTLIFFIVFAFPFCFFIVLKYIVQQKLIVPEGYWVEANQKQISFCEGILSQPQMQVWLKYVSDVKEMNRPLYGYETKALTSSPP